MRIHLLFACALLSIGCAPGSVPAPPAAAPAATAGASTEEAAVVAVAETLFRAMQSRDTTALRRLFLPEARVIALRDGALQNRSVSEFSDLVAASRDELLERMWDARVEVHGDLAALWAPYDFHIGGRFSHCGHDAFHFARRDGRWLIAALTYTVQTGGCPPSPLGSP